MQGLQQHCQLRLRSYLSFTDKSPARYASLTSAIGRGVRRGANSVDRLGTSRRDEKPNTLPSQSSSAPRSRIELERSNQSGRQQPWRQRTRGRNHEPPMVISYEAPIGVPYTTAGSEFLYGTFAVKAALEARRRQLHQLYIWKGENDSRDVVDDSISKLARSKRVRIQAVAGPWEKTMMKMSGQRPHNGYVLEVSPIPKLPVVSLEKMETPNSNVTVEISTQSSEDQLVNSIFAADGSHATIPQNRQPGRYPLLLWLDRVTDTGNLGAIIRTAYYLGVDAIIVPEHGTAPFSPVTIKASAGAAEWLPILTVRREIDFVRASQENGWKFFAAVAPNSVSTKVKASQSLSDPAASALTDSPCVLMVGNEDEGLRQFLQKAANESISIQGAHKQSSVVDSLNVSVAAALLMSRFFDTGTLQ